MNQGQQKVFAAACHDAGLDAPVFELHFHPTRRWRFDACFPDARLAIEVNGGAFLQGGGRHTRGAGYRNDCEKLAEAAILGWRVIPVLPEDITNGRAIAWVQRALGENNSDCARVV